jgi:hypothetical protein
MPIDSKQDLIIVARTLAIVNDALKGLCRKLRRSSSAEQVSACVIEGRKIPGVNANGWFAQNKWFAHGMSKPLFSISR